MLELRPNIGPELGFTDHIDKVLRPEGYRLVGFFVKEDIYAVAVAGFRVINYLAWGNSMYCDDLSTRFEHRKQGHPRQPLDCITALGNSPYLHWFPLASGLG